MVAQRSARVLRRLRQVVLICGTVARQLVGRSRTTAAAVASEEIVPLRPSQSATGVNRTTTFPKIFQFFRTLLTEMSVKNLTNMFEGKQ